MNGLACLTNAYKKSCILGLCNVQNVYNYIYLIIVLERLQILFTLLNIPLIVRLCKTIHKAPNLLRSYFISSLVNIIYDIMTTCIMQILTITALSCNCKRFDASLCCFTTEFLGLNSMSLSQNQTAITIYCSDHKKHILAFPYLV